VLSGTTTAATPWLTITRRSTRAARARFALVPLGPGVRCAPATASSPTGGAGERGAALLTLSDPCGLVRRTWVAAGVGEILVRPRVHEIVPPREAAAASPPREPVGRACPSPKHSASSSASVSTSPATTPSGALAIQCPTRPAARPRRRRPSPRSSRGPPRHAARGPRRVIVRGRPGGGRVGRHRPAPHPPGSRGRHERRRDHAARGVSALDAVLDRLAVLEPEPVDHLAAVTGVLRHRLGLGAVVVVTGTADQTIVDAAAALQGRRIVTMVVTRPSPSPPARSDWSTPARNHSPTRGTPQSR